MKLLIIFAWIWLAGPSDNTAREANRAYEEGDYPRAAQLYREALRETPDAPRLWYNLGNALAQSGESDAAMEAFDRAHDLFETPADRARTQYNAGHVMSGLEQYEEAVRLFRESLQSDPEDADARHNYELAKRRLESSQNEEPNPDESDQGESDDEDNDQESDQNPPQGQQPPSDSPPPSDQENGTPPPSQMSPEEAQSLLDALQQQERELLERRNRTSESEESNDANW